MQDFRALTPNEIIIDQDDEEKPKLCISLKLHPFRQQIPSIEAYFLNNASFINELKTLELPDIQPDDSLRKLECLKNIKTIKTAIDGTENTLRAFLPSIKHLKLRGSNSNNPYGSVYNVVLSCPNLETFSGEEIRLRTLMVSALRENYLSKIALKNIKCESEVYLMKGLITWKGVQNLKLLETRSDLNDNGLFILIKEVLNTSCEYQCKSRLERLEIALRKYDQIDFKKLVTYDKLNSLTIHYTCEFESSPLKGFLPLIPKLKNIQIFLREFVDETNVHSSLEKEAFCLRSSTFYNEIRNYDWCHVSIFPKYKFLPKRHIGSEVLDDIKKIRLN